MLEQTLDFPAVTARAAESGTEADLNAYDTARTTVWPKVKTMLDLK